MPLAMLILIGLASMPPPAALEVRSARFDLYGDPLPKGAVARLGTIRWKGSEQISAIALSPDGKLLAGACGDNQLRIWDYPSGVLLRHYELPYPDGSGLLAFTADQKHIVSGGQNVASPRFTEVASGKVFFAGKVNEPTLSTGTTVSVSGRWSFSWQSDGTRSRFTLFDLAKPTVGRDLGAHAIKIQPGLSKVAISPDGRSCAIGFSDVENPNVAVSKVCVLDTVNGKIWTSPKFQQNNLIGLGYSTDSRSLLVSTLTSFSRWEIKSAKDAAPEVKQAATYQQAWPGSFLVEVIAVSPDGKYVAGGNSTGEIALWNLVNGKSERVWQVSPFNRVTNLAFSPDSKTVAVTTDLGVHVQFFDVASGTERVARRGHSATVSTLTFHPSGKALASASIDDATIRTWDLTSRRTPVSPAKGSIVEERIASREHAVLTHPNGAFLDLAFAEKGQSLFAIQPGGSIVIWDSSKRQRPRELSPMTEGRCMAVAPDGATIAIALPEAGVQLVNARTGELLKQQPAVADAVESLSFREEGKIVSMSTADGRLILWDVAAGRERKALPVGDLGVADRYIASSAVTEQTVSIWDRTTGRIVRRLEQSTLPGTLSPDGRYFASVRADGIELREIATGQVVLVWPLQTLSASVLRFSPDGTIVAAGYGDGTILLWDARPPRPAPGRTPRGDDLAKLLVDLGSSNPVVAFAAIGSLGSVPLETAALIREKFKLPRPIDPAVQAQLLADLEHPRYAVREKATRRLEAIVGQIEAELEQAMWRSGAEAERRIERVLESIRQPIVDAENLRGRRVVELLERLRTAEARELLQKFAKTRGAIARDARDALARLRDR